MSPIAFFTLVIVTIVGLLAIFQIPLVLDVITQTGFAPAEVEAGIGAIIIIFYSVVAVFTVR
jgi:hypothetical protein